MSNPTKPNPLTPTGKLRDQADQPKPPVDYDATPMTDDIIVTDQETFYPPSEDEDA